jgi:hypothetical protein
MVRTALMRHPERMSRISTALPTAFVSSKLHKPVSAAVGLTANAVHLVSKEVRHLPEQITALPMTAATTMLHARVVIRGHFDDLVHRGDEVLHLTEFEAAASRPAGASEEPEPSGKHEIGEDDTVVSIRPPSRFDAVADGFTIAEDE